MPPSLAPELQELFTKQEKQRQELQLRHIVEKVSTAFRSFASVEFALFLLC